MTPNLGQGANSAIESAAALTNSLYDSLQKHPNGLNLTDIEQAFEKLKMSRQKDVTAVFNAASNKTRVEALDGWKNIFIAKFLLPLLSDDLKLKKLASLLVRAKSLSFVDKPKRKHDIPYLDERPNNNGFFSYLGL
jgi:2-polyprenyl-6-methoxyphenol hydroxylase-like FAD-dependent oxidoreductase